ncbi:hypothetical protein AB0M02_00590 [Actinoplanes sp. NPDC051861]|uniref:hypothetical protein n=1 Tax=Actinoplanes sp. NPDC051861 TaxID=3155170 RepID=UPI0034239873
MRKLWCAGAIACGILLGAAPAHAEPLPNPGVAEAPLNALGYALEPTNGWRLGSPLASDPLSGEPLVTAEPGGGRKLVQLEPGNGSDLTNMLPRQKTAQQQAKRIEKPADRRPLLPAADVISSTRKDPAQRPTGALGGVPVSGLPMPMAGQDFTLGNTPVDGYVGALPVLGSLSPAGTTALPGTRAFSPDERPSAFGRTEATTTDFPVLGGLDGTTNTVSDLQRRMIDLQTDFSGLPIGGTPLRRGAKPVPPTTTPTTAAGDTPSAAEPASEPAGAATTDSPAAETPAPAPSIARNHGFSATEADDPRLYEEPVDGFVGD